MTHNEIEIDDDGMRLYDCSDYRLKSIAFSIQALLTYTATMQ